MPRLRGARPSPRHRLAASVPHRIVGPTPAQWLWHPSRLSMWLNDQDGDCVTAEEAFAKIAANPEIFISDATVLAWATANNVLNGTELTTVLDLMQDAGFRQDGATYNDGPFSSVEWTNSTALQNAIATGPVKIGVAADQLENAVPDPPENGWFADGFVKDTNVDHCVSLPGFGSASWLGSQLGISGLPDVPAYALFTWRSIGVITVPSLIAITGEAWLRHPVTRIVQP
jgi:hypothetical protein